MWVSDSTAAAARRNALQPVAQMPEPRRTYQVGQGKNKHGASANSRRKLQTIPSARTARNCLPSPFLSRPPAFSTRRPLQRLLKICKIIGKGHSESS